MTWNNWELKKKKTVTKGCLFKLQLAFACFFLMISVLYTPPFLFHTITTSLFQFYLVLLAVVTNFFRNLVVLFPPPLLPPTCFSNFLPDQGHSPSLPVEMQEWNGSLLWHCGHRSHCAVAAHTVSSQVQLHWLSTACVSKCCLWKAWPSHGSSVWNFHFWSCYPSWGTLKSKNPKNDASISCNWSSIQNVIYFTYSNIKIFSL